MQNKLASNKDIIQIINLRLMTIMTKPGAIIKINLIQNSPARNYLESIERLFLQTLLTKLQNDNTDDLNLNSDEINKLQKIYEKYKKYF